MGGLEVTHFCHLFLHHLVLFYLAVTFPAIWQHLQTVPGIKLVYVEILDSAHDPRNTVLWGVQQADGQSDHHRSSTLYCVLWWHTLIIALLLAHQSRFNSSVDFFSSRVRVSSFLMSSCISALVIIVVTFVFAYLWKVIEDLGLGTNLFL